MLAEFAVLRDMGQVSSKVRPLSVSKAKIKKAKFQLFRELVNRTLCESVLRDKEAVQTWQIFRDTFLRVQEIELPRSKKLGKEGKRLAWLSWDMLVKLKGKKEMHGQWKQGQVS